MINNEIRLPTQEISKFRATSRIHCVLVDLRSRQRSQQPRWFSKVPTDPASDLKNNLAGSAILSLKWNRKHQPRRVGNWKRTHTQKASSSHSQFLLVIRPCECMCLGVTSVIIWLQKTRKAKANVKSRNGDEPLRFTYFYTLVKNCPKKSHLAKNREKFPALKKS